MWTSGAFPGFHGAGGRAQSGRPESQAGHLLCGAPPLSSAPSSAWPAALRLAHRSGRSSLTPHRCGRFPLRSLQGPPHRQLYSLAPAAFTEGLSQPYLLTLLSPQWALLFRHARTLNFSAECRSFPRNTPKLPPAALRVRCASLYVQVPTSVQLWVSLFTGRGRSRRGTSIQNPHIRS